jgi:hypothetical protein
LLHACCRDLEVTAPVPGVISLALCPAAPEHSAGQKATIEAIPLMVSPDKGGSAEAVAMFDCMKQLVQQQGHTQQQLHASPYPHPHHHHQQQQQAVDCWAAAGGISMPAAPAAQLLAGMDAPEGLSFSAPANEQLAAAEATAASMPGACCACCGFGKPEAAAEQALLRTTWQQHFLPLLLDMHAALTCAPKPVSCKHHSAATAAAEQLAAAAPDSGSRSFAAAARIPNPLEGWAQHATAATLRSFNSPTAASAAHATAAASTAAAGQQPQPPARPAILLELAGCAPPPVDVAGQMLIGVVEFLALHNCWCNVSFLLAEAFKNGLLATTGVLAVQQLQRLHELQSLQAPVCAAALTAVSLVSALAEGAAAAAVEAADEEEDGTATETASGPAAKPSRSITAGTSIHHPAAAAAAPALAPAPAAIITPAIMQDPAGAAFAPASKLKFKQGPSAPAAAGRAIVLAVLLLLVMPAAALVLAAAEQPGEANMLCAQAPFVGSLGGLLAICAGAAAVPALYAAVMSVVLLAMMAATCRRMAPRKQG